jgi:hypothetical protein
MRKLSRLWTEEDDALLRRLVASGASATRASVALKRSKTHTQARARELGTPFPDLRVQRQKRMRAEQEQRKKEGLPPEPPHPWRAY